MSPCFRVQASFMTEEWEQIFLYERANIMNLGDIRFQWNMGLMDDNPYNSQVRKAANSVNLLPAFLLSS